jgi:Flp pilus assembly protein TadG
MSLQMRTSERRAGRSLFCVLRRFARHRSGATAIEFGMVAAPFLGLMFAVIETAMVFFAGQTLETTVADSSRLIMTGQAQGQGFSASQFKADVCARASMMFDCSKLAVAVQTYTDFSKAQQDVGLDPKSLVDTSGNFKTFPYNQGCPNEIVLVRVMYQWPVYVSMPGLDSLANVSAGKRMLLATAAFRNEPYSATC